MILRIKIFFITIWEYLAAPFRAVKFLYEFKKYGYHEIRTVFEHPLPDGTTRSHAFRTLIQPGADIINFLPEMDKYYQHDNYMEVCQANYNLHQERIFLFVNSVLRHETMLAKIFDGTLIIPTVSAFLEGIREVIEDVQAAHDLTYQEMFLAIGVPSIALAIRKFLKNKALSFIKQGVFKVVMFFVEKKFF
ncbi:MAG: hypothetical protein EAZ97_05755 [Bacteroidetes bacterium]|nr:MAG: hypothetical protein EAZ97_05755 [Bacteroidota bacterium]